MWQKIGFIKNEWKYCGHVVGKKSKLAGYVKMEK